MTYPSWTHLRWMFIEVDLHLYAQKNTHLFATEHLCVFRITSFVNVTGEMHVMAYRILYYWTRGRKHTAVWAPAKNWMTSCRCTLVFLNCNQIVIVTPCLVFWRYLHNLSKPQLATNSSRSLGDFSFADDSLISQPNATDTIIQTQDHQTPDEILVLASCWSQERDVTR